MNISKGYIVASVLLRINFVIIRGFLAHKKTPTPLGPPQGPNHSPTVGTYRAAVCYEQGTPVHCQLEWFDIKSTPHESGHSRIEGR